MPRVKQYKSADQVLTDAVKGKATVNCGGIIGLAAPLKCCRTTVYAMMRNPRSWSIREVGTIRKACGMTREEMLELIAPLI